MIKIIPHLGLGDFICLTPLILKIADGNDVTVPCWEHNLVSVKSFFVNNPNVHLLTVKDESDIHNFYTQKDVIRMGVYNPTIPPLENEDYITWIHRQLGLTEIVYDDILQVASKKTVQILEDIEDYFFLHQDYERHFIIDKSKYPMLPLITNTFKGGSILSYAEALKKAKEIHVIDSSFLHLTEALPTTGELFFHKYARDGGALSDYKFRKKWTTYA